MHNCFSLVAVRCYREPDVFPEWTPERKTAPATLESRPDLAPPPVPSVHGIPSP